MKTSSPFYGSGKLSSFGTMFKRPLWFTIFFITNDYINTVQERIEEFQRVDGQVKTISKSDEGGNESKSYLIFNIILSWSL